MALVIGLTGGIASGKSTVSKMFKDNDIPVIDTDTIAKKLVDHDSEVIERIVETFGEEVLTPSRTINRNKLAKIIFSSKDQRARLNAIVHPKVEEHTLHEIEYYTDEGEEIIVIDVPLLFEAGFDALCDYTLVVYSKQKDQVSRLMSRENIDEAYAKQKIKAQMPLSKKREMADFTIDNSQSILQTRKCFEKVLKKIKAKL